VPARCSTSTSAGIDIVPRQTRKNFFVLEDNARTPSGVSYMLENREIMMRLFPGPVLPATESRPVERYPDGAVVGIAIGWRRSSAAAEADGGADDARRLQLRLLRAFISRPTSSASSWSRAADPHRQER